MHNDKDTEKVMRLLRAIGDVDEADIAAAAPRARTVRPFWRVFPAVAACFLALLIALPFLIQITKMGAPMFDASGGNNFSPEKENAGNIDDAGASSPLTPGKTASFAFGALTYEVLEDESLTFTLSLFDFAEIHLFLRSYSEQVDSEGEVGRTYYYFTTNENEKEARPEEEWVEDGIVISVDGTPCLGLPTAPGNYRITLDFSLFSEAVGGLKEGDYIAVTGFPSLAIK